MITDSKEFTYTLRFGNGIKTLENATTTDLLKELAKRFYPDSQLIINNLQDEYGSISVQSSNGIVWY